MASIAWNVYLNGQEIDTVFFDADIDAWHAKHSLVNHDGYNPDIEVEPASEAEEVPAGAITLSKDDLDRFAALGLRTTAGEELRALIVQARVANALLEACERSIMGTSDKLQRDTPYRLADRLTPDECRQCGVNPNRPQEHLAIMAVWDGRPRRPPKAGEWYLSGAIIEAWRAPNDYLDSMAYHIARLVRVERREVMTFTEIGEEDSS